MIHCIHKTDEHILINYVKDISDDKKIVSIVYAVDDLHQLAVNGAGSDPINSPPFVLRYILCLMQLHYN